MAKTDLVRRIDLENFSALTASTPTGTGAGAHYFATYTVAAVDSTPAEIAGADFVCDGIADEEQISLALASKIGGYARVLLLSGKFTLSATVLFTYPNCTLEGQGTATVLVAATGFSDPQLVTAWQNYSKVANLAIDCGGDGNPDGISIYSVIGCEVSGLSSFGGVPGYNISATINIDSCQDCMANNCRLQGLASTGIAIAGDNCSATSNAIRNCYAAISARDGYNLLVANNVIRYCYNGISVGAPHTLVTGNQCVGSVATDIDGEFGYVGDYGITVTGCDSNIISNNYMTGFSAAGLYLDTSVGNKINDNYIAGNSFTSGLIISHVNYDGRGIVFRDATSNYIANNYLAIGLSGFAIGQQWFPYELLGDSGGNTFYNNYDYGNPYPFNYELPNPGFAEFDNTHGNIAIYEGANETIAQIKITTGYRIVPPLEYNVVHTLSVLTTTYSSINFIEKGWSGRDIYLRAYDSPITLVNSLIPDSLTANLILNGADVTLTAEKIVHLKFDGDLQFWYLVVG